MNRKPIKKLWLSTCESAYAFDEWKDRSGLIIIGNSGLNDAGPMKFLASVRGGTAGDEVDTDGDGIWDDFNDGDPTDGIEGGESVEYSFHYANDYESGHDLEIKDNYEGDLFLR